MSTLALNSDNDIYLQDNKLVLITGTNTDNEILQRVKFRLRFFRDEWFLDSSHGVPYFDGILGEKPADLDILDSILRSEISGVNGIKEITESSLDFNSSSRELTYSFKATTINNTVLIDQLIVI